MRWIVAALMVLVPAVTFSQTCVPVPHGAISWYRAEGNAQDSIGTNHGGATNVTYGPGIVNQGFVFPGAQNSSIHLGNVAAFDFNATSSFTIEAWIYVASLTVPAGNDAMTIVSLSYSCNLVSPTVNLAIQAATRQAFFHVRDASTQRYVFSPAPVSARRWIHVVAVRDATCSPKQLRLYLNGVLVATATDPTTGPLFTTGPSADYIGRRPPCATTNPFNGLIDEVTFYNRALTACEVAALFNANCAGKCPFGGCPTNQSGNCGC